MSEHAEAPMTISGVTLTEAQSATIRVGVEHFLMDLSDPSYMRDLGPIGPLYRERLKEIQTLIFRTCR